MRSKGMVKVTVSILALAFAVGTASWMSGAVAASPADVDWPAFSGHVTGDHYSSLTQINRGNVAKLKVAWTYDTGEGGSLETNPVIVGDTLYAFTSSQKVIALNAATGRLKWSFDSGIKGTQPARGVVYRNDGKNGVIYAGVMNFLYALDARTGKPIAAFGENGRVDLRKNLRGDYEQNGIALTTPGVIYKDVLIVGGRTPESNPAPPGDVRAYDVDTGALRWSFHTMPHPGEEGFDSWSSDSWQKLGSANNWAGMALDEKRGIAYIPTGSAAFDFFGGTRVGDNLYANSLLAIDARTGKRLWHFQGVHHDVWDRDFPAHPVLLTVKRDGRSIDAVAQISKQGFLFVFDRVTGKPLFPIEERAARPSTVPGEVLSKTQPYPTGIAPFARQHLTEDLLTDRTPAAHNWAVEEFRKFHSDGQFTPLALDKRTVVFPGFNGGGEWGGPGVDPKTGVIYINASDSPWTGGLALKRAGGGAGADLYQAQCAICHQADRAGSPPDFPSLVGVTGRMTDVQIAAQVRDGKGRMPAFPAITAAQMTDLVGYLKSADQQDNARPPAQEGAAPTGARPAADAAANVSGPYAFTGYRHFDDPDGYPAVKPPWGTLNAIDLNTGKYLFKTPLGEYPELTAKGMAPTGTENYGGPVVTAGGVVFIAATMYDGKIRAFDSKTGKQLWEAQMPGSGVATPATYSVGGRQFVVIATSPTKSATPASAPAPARGAAPKPGGGLYIAFALPK